MLTWLAVLLVWILLALTNHLHDVSLPWVLTILCWSQLDLTWHLCARDRPATGPAPLRARLLSAIPYLLYCLPLSGVPFLGQRLFPRSPAIAWAGAAACFAGIAFAIHARRTLARNWTGGVHVITTTTAPPDAAAAAPHTLVQRGPYALVRHPIYLGLILAQLGMIAALGEVRALVLACGILLLLRKLPHEEAALQRAYPADYPAYARRVPRLIPGVW